MIHACAQVINSLVRAAAGARACTSTPISRIPLSGFRTLIHTGRAAATGGSRRTAAVSVSATHGEEVET